MKTKQNSILVLEDYLLNTILGHQSVVSHQRLNKIADVTWLEGGAYALPE